MAEWWTKPTRRALESHAKPLIVAAFPTLHIRWPGFELPTPKPDEYVRFSFHPGGPVVKTMGPNGRKEASGFGKFGVFTKLGESQDRNDSIAGAIALMFPYNLNLERDGVSVTISTIDHGTFVENDGYGYSPVDVNWTVWRTT